MCIAHIYSITIIWSFDLWHSIWSTPCSMVAFHWNFIDYVTHLMHNCVKNQKNWKKKNNNKRYVCNIGWHTNFDCRKTDITSLESWYLNALDNIKISNRFVLHFTIKIIPKFRFVKAHSFGHRLQMQSISLVFRNDFRVFLHTESVKSITQHVNQLKSTFTYGTQIALVVVFQSSAVVESTKKNKTWISNGSKFSNLFST